MYPRATEEKERHNNQKITTRRIDGKTTMKKNPHLFALMLCHEQSLF